MKTELKERAIKYRLQGKTYTEISKLLGLSKSTLSFWLKDLILGKKAKQNIELKYKAGYTKGLLKKSKQQSERARKQHSITKKQTAKTIGKLSNRELLILGAGLYWGEGYKKSKMVNNVEKTVHQLSLSNSDPILIRGYIQFLYRVCNVPKSKIRASIRMYKNQNEFDILKYWCKVTGLSKQQFTKPYIGVSKSSLGKKPFNTLPYGTIRIDVYNTDLFYKVIGWIDGIKANFDS